MKLRQMESEATSPAYKEIFFFFFMFAYFSFSVHILILKNFIKNSTKSKKVELLHIGWNEKKRLNKNVCNSIQ